MVGSKEANRRRRTGRPAHPRPDRPLGLWALTRGPRSGGAAISLAALAAEAGVNRQALWQMVVGRDPVSASMRKKVDGAIGRLGLVFELDPWAPLPPDLYRTLRRRRPGRGGPGREQFQRFDQDGWDGWKKDRRPLMLPDECLRHFGLSAEPFEMPSLAEDFWPHPQMHVVAGLVDKTIRRAGFLLVQGPSGCGKTAITRYAVGNLVGDARRNIPRAEGYHVARLLTLRRRTATGCALPRALLRDFAPGVRPRSSAEDLVDQVASMIATKYKAGQNCTVVIEEAHELSADLWLDLKKLREICDEAGGGLGVICVGQTEGHPNLDETLDQPDLVSVRRRVFVCEIRPLSPGQARKYVEHRLARAGARVGAVLPEAIEFLLKYLAPGGRGSTGMALYPALLDTWIGRAMVQAWDKGARSVGAAIMSYCLKTGGDVAGGEETPESRSDEVTK